MLSQCQRRSRQSQKILHLEQRQELPVPQRSLAVITRIATYLSPPIRSGQTHSWTLLFSGPGDSRAFGPFLTRPWQRPSKKSFLPSTLTFSTRLPFMVLYLEWYVIPFIFARPPHCPLLKCGQVSQRLLEWRSGFGSTALVMVIHYFWELMKHASMASEASNALVQQIAMHLISPPHFPFTHEDCDNLNPTRNFRSDFIIKLVANAHLSKTLHAATVQSLGTAALQKGYGMESVIALASAAVKFSCTV